LNKNVELKKLASELKFSINELKLMSIQEFKNKFRKLSSKNCIYYLGRCEVGDKSIEMRDVIEESFYKMSCSPKYKNRISKIE
jgi:hypothetical protein